jgi:hypothetical protein
VRAKGPKTRILGHDAIRKRALISTLVYYSMVLRLGAILLSEAGERVNHLNEGGSRRLESVGFGLHDCISGWRSGRVRC